MDRNIIEIRNLKTAYGNRIIHEGLNLDVRKGEILSIVGGSGSGKSTLLRVMLLLKEPVEGSVKINGVEVSRLSELEKQRLRNRMGVLFQSAALFSSITVGENIVYAITKRSRIPKEIACEMALVKLQLANLTSDVFNMYPSELSGGMRKKAGLARALAIDPDILFLDEPTSGLDPISADEFDRTIRKIVDLLGITVVMITHDLSSLLISDRVAILAEGKIIFSGALKDVVSVENEWIKKLFSGERGRRFLVGV